MSPKRMLQSPKDLKATERTPSTTGTDGTPLAHLNKRGQSLTQVFEDAAVDQTVTQTSKTGKTGKTAADTSKVRDLALSGIDPTDVLNIMFGTDPNEQETKKNQTAITKIQTSKSPVQPRKSARIAGKTPPKADKADSTVSSGKGGVKRKHGSSTEKPDGKKVASGKKTKSDGGKEKRSIPRKAIAR